MNKSDRRRRKTKKGTERKTVDVIQENGMEHRKKV